MEDVTLKDDCQKVQALLAETNSKCESQLLNQTFIEKETRGMSDNKALRKIPSIVLCKN